jgi:hypothetical protein
MQPIPSAVRRCARRLACLLCAGALAGCSSLIPKMPSPVGLAWQAVTPAIGVANASVIGPQEQALFEKQSCAELASMIERYETASSAAAQKQMTSVKYTPVMATITVRLDYMKKLYATRGC